MAHVEFTPNLQRHLAVPALEVEGRTVREALDRVFAQNQALRGYVVDEHGHLRQHVVVFVDGDAVRDRRELSDPITAGAQIFVMQALSGG